MDGDVGRAVEQQLSSSGVLDALRSQLRAHVLGVLLKQGVVASTRAHIPVGSAAYTAMGLVKDFLDAMGLEHTASMLLAELQDGAHLTRDELLEELSLSAGKDQRAEPVLVLLMDSYKEIRHAQVVDVEEPPPAAAVAAVIAPMASLSADEEEEVEEEPNVVKSVQSTSFQEDDDDLVEPEPVRSFTQVKRHTNAIVRSSAGWNTDGHDSKDFDEEEDEKDEPVDDVSAKKPDDLGLVEEDLFDEDLSDGPESSPVHQSESKTRETRGLFVSDAKGYPDASSVLTSASPVAESKGSSQFDYVIDENSGDEETENWNDAKSSQIESGDDSSYNPSRSVAEAPVFSRSGRAALPTFPSTNQRDDDYDEDFEQSIVESIEEEVEEEVEEEEVLKEGASLGREERDADAEDRSFEKFEERDSVLVRSAAGALRSLAEAVGEQPPGGDGAPDGATTLRQVATRLGAATATSRVQDDSFDESEEEPEMSVGGASDEDADYDF